MRASGRPLLAVILALVAALAAAGAAAAWWRSPGHGTGSAATGSLRASTWVNATQPNTDIQTVHVTWAAAASPDGDIPDGYWITRTQGGVTTDACDTAANSPLGGTLTACDDTDVPLGMTTYTVTALYATWTAAAGSAQVEVVAHALTSFTVVAATATPVAGAPFTVTITAIAADGGTKPDYAGAQCVLLSGPSTSPSGATPIYPAAGSCPAGSSVDFAAGVGTATVTLTTAETVGIRVADGATGLFGTSQALAVSSAGATALAVGRPPSGTATAGTAFARQPRITITDAYGNVETASTAAVTLAVKDGGATIACTVNPVAAVAGVASFAGCAMTKAGTWTLRATSGTLPPVDTSSVTVSAAGASSIAVSSGAGQSAAAGAPFGSAMVALVSDAYGNPVAGATVTFTAPGSGSTVSFGGASTTSVATSATGLATSYTVTAGTAAGTGSVAATSAGTPGTSFGFTVTAAAAARLAITQQPSTTAVAGVAFGTQPRVGVTDTYGNPVTSSTASVSMAITGGLATVSCAANPVSAVGGIASFAACAISQTGTWTLTATSAGLASAVTSSITVSSSSLGAIAISSGSPQTATAGATFGAGLVAIASDTYGNPLAGVTVTFTAPSTGARATWSGAAATSAVTDASGLATVPAPLAGTVAGSYTVTAAAGAFSVSFALTNAPAAPTKLQFTTQPAASMVAHTTFGATVAITDTYGNVVTTIASTSLSLVLSPSTSLAGCSSASTVAGVATWSGCTYDVAGTGYALAASGGGYTAATSSAFAITPGPAATVSVNSGSAQTATVNAAFGAALSAKVVDAYGNLISGATVTFTAPATGATAKWSTLTTTTAVTAATGIATTTVPTASTVSGAYSVTAATGTATSATFTLTNLSGTATKLTFIQQPAGATAGQAFVTQPKVAITDTYGNTVTTATGTIALAITSGTGTAGASLSSCAGGGAASGVSTFTNCKINTAGTGYTLRATLSGYTAGTSAAFNVTAALVTSSWSIVNKTGGTLGTTETGDKVVVTFSVAPRASTMCAAWTSDTTAYSLTDAVVSFNNNGNNDTITFTSASCSAGLKLGTITVGSYIGSTQTTTYTASTLAWDPTTRTVTVTLGTTTKTVTSGSTFTMSFAVSTSIQDQNGRSASGSASWSGRAF